MSSSFNIDGGLSVSDNTVVDNKGNIVEGIVQLAEATGTVVYDLNNSLAFEHGVLGANFTANFTNMPTTTNRAVSVVLILNQGATAYMPTAVQIDGSAQTILWANGSAPEGLADGIDIVSFTFVRSNGALKVFGSSVGFANA